MYFVFDFCWEGEFGFMTSFYKTTAFHDYFFSKNILLFKPNDFSYYS